MTEEFPADWYDDPNAPGGRVKRYWDGSAWTDHVFDTQMASANPSPGPPETTDTEAETAPPPEPASATAALEAATTPINHDASATATADSSSSVSSPPAGWYDDPTTGGEIKRYWDGDAWTEHTHDTQAETAPDKTEPVADSASAETEHPVATNAQASTVSYEAEVEPQKIGMFGARKAAKQLSEVNQELRDRVSALEATVAKYGLLELAEREQHLSVIARQITDEESRLASLRAEIESLKASLVESRDSVALQEMGIFDYEHPAEHSATLATQLEALRYRIKQTNKIGSAIEATTNFTYNNSAAKGRTFVNQMSRIMLRAYNAEAENAVKRVRAGNLAAAQKRLSTAATQIEKQGTMIDLRISEGYHALRLQELELAARHLQVLANERELERERKAELREQNAFEQEARRERERLDKERAHYMNAANRMREQGNEVGALELEERLAGIDKEIEDLDYRSLTSAPATSTSSATWDRLAKAWSRSG